MKVSHWLKTVLSIPRRETLTRTANFTQWSALLAYSGGGLTMLCAPIIWHVTLNLDFSKRSGGYLRLTGCYLFALSFLYVILSRSSSRAPGGLGPILGSVLERLFYVNGALLMMYTRGMVPLLFGIVFIALDTSLGLVTAVLWFCETDTPSAKLFFQEISTAFCSTPDKDWTTSARVVQTIGVIQIVSGFVLMIIPSQMQTFLRLDSFVNGTYTAGFLSCTFLLISVHGMFHILAGAGEAALPFGVTALFYRVFLVLPILVILFALDQIELRLFLFLGSLDLTFVLALLVSFLSQYKKNRRVRVEPKPTGLIQTEWDG